MSTPGCCIHCWEGCQAVAGWHTSAPFNRFAFTWQPGTCVRCKEIADAVTAERERIITALNATFEQTDCESPKWLAGWRDALIFAQQIARGEL